MTRLLTAAAVLTVALTGLQGARAEDFKAGSLEIAAPWTRATPPGAKVAGGFMAITNKGTEPDRLVGGSLPQAGRFEVHEMAVTDGVMKMRELDKGLEIKPGETVTLKPGGYHVMFIELKDQIKEGGKLAGTLKFEKAGEVAVTYEIAPIGAGKPAMDHSGHGAGSGSAVQR